VTIVALRCSGYNNVDLDEAKRLDITVTHVPIYSPFSVAEHAAALLLALNRKTHKVGHLSITPSWLDNEDSLAR